MDEACEQLAVCATLSVSLSLSLFRSASQAIWPPHRVGQLVEACVKFLCLRRVSCQQTIKSFIFNAGTSYQASILSHCCSWQAVRVLVCVCVCVVSDFIISFRFMSSSAELLIKFPSLPFYISSSLHMPIENGQFRVLSVEFIIKGNAAIAFDCVSLKFMHKSRQQNGSSKGRLRLPCLACHKLCFIAIKKGKLNLSFYADKYIIIIHFTLCIYSLKVNLLLIYLLILNKHLITRVGVNQCATGNTCSTI